MLKHFNTIFAILLASLASYAQKSSFYDSTQIHEVRIIFSTHQWIQILDSLHKYSDESSKLEATVKIDGKIYQNAGIRYKGYSSWAAGVKKNPFNIELDYKHKNQNHCGFTKLKLCNVIHDPSFVREVLAYEIARKYMSASEANFANLYVNDTLIGLYTNVESVDQLFVKKQFNSKNNCFFKGKPETLKYPLGDNANLAYNHGSDSSGYIPYYSLMSDYGWNQIVDFIKVLNNNTDSIPMVLDVDQTLWMHALNFSILNLDSYIAYSQNYYMYKNDNQQFCPIVWDLNMSFGSFRNSDGSYNYSSVSIAQLKILNPLQYLEYSVSPRPLITQLLKQKRYQRMMMAHIRTIINENLENKWYLNRAKRYQTQIDNAVQADSNKFYSYTYFLKNLSSDVGSGVVKYPGIQPLIEGRIEYLKTLSGYNGEPQLSNSSYSPLIPAKNETVCFKVKVQDADSVFLSYRTASNEVFKTIVMYDDGQHNDSLANDHVYGSSITSSNLLLQYYFYAENDSAGCFLPARAASEFFTIYNTLEQGAITINEVAINSSIADKNEQLSQWIELCNTSNENICTKNTYISNNSSNTTLFKLPDTIIPAKSYLILWASKSSVDAVHCGFDLSTSQSASIYLSNNKGQIIDSVSYDTPPSTCSIGRYPNGYGKFVSMKPSFAASNDVRYNQELDAQVYPNPTNSEVFIEMQNDVYIQKIEILTAQLMPFFSQEYNQEFLSFLNIKLDVTNYPSGIYIVKIYTPNGNINKKIIIN